MRQDAPKYRVLVVGEFWLGALEASYARAFELTGAEVMRFQYSTSFNHYALLGRFGKLLNTFYPLEAWHNKANRELVLAAAEFDPDLVVVGGSNPVRVGALAQIRARNPNAKLILIWPDTLLRLLPHVPATLGMYDLIASYARSAIEPFSRLGARQAVWVPLAADPELHRPQVLTGSEQRLFTCDVVFIGNHRPEREKLIVSLMKAGVSVKVWGSAFWKRKSVMPSLVGQYWQGRELYGADFAKALGAAKISLNPIDPTNFPAANMRFFEVPACGGLALNSRCPEMEDIFRDGETTLYYDEDKTAVDVVLKLLAKPSELDQIARRGTQHVLHSHTYVHRVKRILSELKFSIPADQDVI